jgi:hypothetical protein
MAEKLPVQPRFLSREQAAAYVGVCPNVFDSEVRDGIWPPAQRRGARLGRLTWDLKLLDLYADRYSGLASPPAPTQHGQIAAPFDESAAVMEQLHAYAEKRIKDRRPKAA